MVLGVKLVLKKIRYPLLTVIFTMMFMVVMPQEILM